MPSVPVIPRAARGRQRLESGAGSGWCGAPGRRGNGLEVRGGARQGGKTPGKVRAQSADADAHVRGGGGAAAGAAVLDVADVPFGGWPTSAAPPQGAQDGGRYRTGCAARPVPSADGARSPRRAATRSAATHPRDRRTPPPLTSPTSDTSSIASDPGADHAMPHRATPVPRDAR